MVPESAMPRLSRGRACGRVSWQALTLQGFGLFCQPVRVEFSEGLVTLVGPNESGKSTLVVGLMAVLFGLRSTRDPRLFGRERFRSWGRAERFAGELEFIGGDGQCYRLSRDFDNHVVELSRLHEGDWTLELRGVDNPGARQRNAEIEARLRQLIGLGSREVFAATFCVNQPLPGMVEIDEAVQQLLSGAGRQGHAKAMDRLALQLSTLTSQTADLGVTTRNGLRDQRLEILRHELEAGSRGLEDSREAMGTLPALEMDIAGKVRKQEEVREALATHEMVVDAMGQWATLAERHRGASRKVADLQQALAEANRLHGTRQALQRRLDEEPAGELGPETGQWLESLLRVEDALERVREERACLQAEVEGAECSLGEMELLFRQEFGGLEGRPDPVRALESLREKVEERSSLERRVAELSELEEGLRLELAGLPDLARVGRPAPEACRRLREEQGEALREWQRWHDSKECLAGVERELADYAVLERASEETLETLRNHAALREQLLARRYEAVNELEQAELRRMAAQHEMGRIRNAFVDVAALDASVIPVMEEKIRLAQRKEALDEQLASAYRVATRLSERRLWLIVAGLLLGLAAGGGSAILLHASSATGLAASLLSAVACGALGAGVARIALRDPLGATQEALARWGADMAAVDERLGVHAGDAIHRLGEVKERWGRWQDRLREYDEAFKDLPDAEYVATLRDRRDESDKSLAELKAKVRGYAMQFQDPVEAIQRWKELRGERARVESERETFCREEWGCAAADVPDLELGAAGGKWRRLGVILALGGRGRDDRVLELIRTMRTTDEDWWEDLITQAERWEELTRRLEAVLSERDLLVREDASGASSLERISRRIEVLRGLVAPYDEHADVDLVRHQVASARSLELRMEATRSKVLELGRREAEVIAEIAGMESEQLRLRGSLARVLEAAGGNVSEAREHWRRAQELRRQLEGVEGQLASSLKLWGVDTPAALEARCHEAVEGLRALEESLRDICERFPELPGSAGVDDPLMGEKVDQALRQRGVELKREAEAVAEELRSLESRRARLQGRELVNLAVADREVERVRGEVEEMALEVESLALAWREMQATVEHFQVSHRERLEQAATRRFEELSGRVGRAVCLDDNFRISLREDGGRPVLPGQLSQGARDQLYLCMRLAISDLVSPSLRMPFVFDDPFLNCDEGRLERLRQVLSRIACERQVIVLSHRSSIAGWGRPAVPHAC